MTNVDSKPHIVHLTCTKCTRQKTFKGGDKWAAFTLARQAGWGYVHTRGFVCPKCPCARANDHNFAEVVHAAA